jgi:taurine transport system permease protein
LKSGASWGGEDTEHQTGRHPQRGGAKALRIQRLYRAPARHLARLLLLHGSLAGAARLPVPQPGRDLERYQQLMENPIKDLNIYGTCLGEPEAGVHCADDRLDDLGISFGILTGWNRKADALFTPLFTAFRSVPPLAWIPLITIWFGTIGEERRSWSSSSDASAPSSSTPTPA